MGSLTEKCVTLIAPEICQMAGVWSFYYHSSLILCIITNAIEYNKRKTVISTLRELTETTYETNNAWNRQCSCNGVLQHLLCH